MEHTENFDEVGANLQRAIRHGEACRVNKKLNHLKETRDFCVCTQSCGCYVPEADDKYEVLATNTDDLWHLGVGYSLHFTFGRLMSGMLLFVCLLYCVPIIVQSYLIFYDTIKIEGSDRKNTGLLIFGSYYSIFQLRLSYSFDYGIWVNNNYWYIQACMQVALFLMAAHMIRQVSAKFQDLKLKNNLISV